MKSQTKTWLWVGAISIAAGIITYLYGIRSNNLSKLPEEGK